MESPHPLYGGWDLTVATNRVSYLKCGCRLNAIWLRKRLSKWHITYHISTIMENITLFLAFFAWSGFVFALSGKAYLKIETEIKMIGWSCNFNQGFCCLFCLAENIKSSKPNIIIMAKDLRVVMLHGLPSAILCLTKTFHNLGKSQSSCPFHFQKELRPLWYMICCNNPLCSSWNAIRSCIKKIITYWELAGRYMTALTVECWLSGGLGWLLVFWLGLGFACSIFHGFLYLFSPKPQNAFRWALQHFSLVVKA